MGSLYRRKSKGHWHATFSDESGKRVRRSTGVTHKKLAEEILKKWEDDAAILRNGLIVDAAADLRALVEQYIDYLGNSTPKHRGHNRHRLNTIIDPNGWTVPTEINQYQVETTVRQLCHPKTGKPIALRTQSHYLAAFKSFTKWLTNVRRVLAVDPLAAVKKPRFDRDRKVIRRFLTPAEWLYLSQTDHALLYETAIQTGFRSYEVLSVQPEHLHNDHIILPAKFAKNHIAAKQYISHSLQQRLVGNLPFQVANRGRMAEMLRRDLNIAKRIHIDLGPSNRPASFLAPIDERGHVLDFHSLRHTCGAWLAMANVSPKTIQSVMRHSSITLTLDTYGHLFQGVEQDAANVLAKILDVT